MAYFLPGRLTIFEAAAWFCGMEPRPPFFEKGPKLRLKRLDGEASTDYEKRNASFFATVRFIKKLIEHGDIEMEKNAQSGPFSGSIVTTSLRLWAEGNGCPLGERDITAALGIGQKKNRLQKEGFSEKLTMLLQASGKFWANASPTDPETHPVKKDVVRWLEERGMSKYQAEAGATIIAPKWAVKGRRPQK
jgi:hypothetical protein